MDQQDEIIESMIRFLSVETKQNDLNLLRGTIIQNVLLATSFLDENRTIDVIQNIDGWSLQMENFIENIFNETSKKADVDSLLLTFTVLLSKIYPGIDWLSFLLKLKMNIGIKFRHD
jgi:hypothetical protein